VPIRVEAEMTPAADAGAGGPSPDDVRAFHRRFPTGVTVVTAMGADAPRGLVVNAFSSLTLEPPRILVCVARTSQSYETLFRARGFAVNVLSAEQEPVARAFARSGADKFADVRWERGVLDAPIIEGSSAVAEARSLTRVDVDTHTIFIGEVVDVRVSDRPPLLYWDGNLWEPEKLRPLRTQPAASRNADHGRTT
jgi:flavin reductase (DIM6/NTAB) family NADH-FMN oxidoreductase RutF